MSAGRLRVVRRSAKNLSPVASQSLDVLGMSGMEERVTQHWVLQAPLVVCSGKREKCWLAASELKHRRARHKKYPLMLLRRAHAMWDSVRDALTRTAPLLPMAPFVDGSVDIELACAGPRRQASPKLSGRCLWRWVGHVLVRPGTRRRRGLRAECLVQRTRKGLSVVAAGKGGG